MSKIPAPTRWEKGLVHIAPGLARKIYETRTAFSMASSYHGASKSRRTMSGWNTSSGDADADLLPELQDLRENSRDLYRNSSLGGAGINTAVTSIIGTGLSLQCRLNRSILKLSDEQAAEWESKAEAEFNLWAEKCDVTRQLSFSLLQELAFRSTLENGDVLTSTPYNKYKGDAYGLKIQLTEADRINNPNHATDSDTFSGGVERDVNGVVKNYHVQTSHPGNAYAHDQTWKAVKAFGANGHKVAWLLYHKQRVGQNRGIPFLAPVIEEIKQLSRMTENEITRAVVSSLFTAFVKTNSGEGLGLGDLHNETGGSSSDEDLKMGSGLIVDMGANDEDIIFADPKTPNVNLDPFFQAVTTQIGARLEIPREVLLKLFNTSYTAAQAAFLEAWRFFMCKRFWLAEQFCRPIYELFLTEAVASGRIHAPGFLNGDPLIRKAWLGSDWIGDAKGHLKETEAVSAAILRIESGLSNEAIETTALTGRDRDAVYAQRLKEIKQRREDDTLATSSTTLGAAELETTGSTDEE